MDQRTAVTVTAAHRRRAVALGLVGTMLLLVAAAAALRVTVEQVAAVRSRATVQMDDGVLVVALALVCLSLLWLAITLALGCRTLLQPQRGIPDPTERLVHLSPAFVGRLTALLLAVTAASSVAQAGPARAATSVSATHDRHDQLLAGLETAPTPQFGTAAAGSRAATTAPAPGFGDAADATAAPAPGFGEGAAAAGAPVPDWSAGPYTAASPDRAGLLGGRHSAATDADVIVVRRGDSLWSIVQRHLGPEADDAEVAAAWPRWYAANRSAIGADPDLLLPGTTLHAPTTEVSR